MGNRGEEDGQTEQVRSGNSYTHRLRSKSVNRKERKVSRNDESSYVLGSTERISLNREKNTVPVVCKKVHGTDVTRLNCDILDSLFS